MKAFTKDIVEKFQKNLLTPKNKRKPVVKIYSPCLPIKFLFSEYDSKTHVFHGLIDTGYGCPSKGWINLEVLSELENSMKIPFKHDEQFIADKTLDEYTKQAQFEGQINS